MTISDSRSPGSVAGPFSRGHPAACLSTPAASHGAPAPDSSLPPSLIGASHAVHWSLYLLLLATPIIVYAGISYGRYLDVFGFPLPPLTIEDKKFSETIFEYHEMAAFILVALANLHILAAIYHRFILKDRVVERMLPYKIKMVQTSYVIRSKEGER